MQNTDSRLKIKSVVAVEARDIPFSVGLVPPWNPSQLCTSRDWVFVMVTTGEGLWGVGYDGEYSPRLPATAKTINEEIAPHLVGRQVDDFEHHTSFFKHLTLPGRYNFIEWILYDIHAQSKAVPLYELWGGQYGTVPVYAATCQHGRSPAERGRDCIRFRDRGFKAVKLRLSSETIEGDIALVEACRDAIGDTMDILVDANQVGRLPGRDNENVFWGLERALATAQALGRLGVYYLEEPLDYSLKTEGQKLRAASPIPIAGGEGLRWQERFRDVLEDDVFDILQPDPLASATPTELLQIGRMIADDGRKMICHHGKGGYGFVAGLHLSAAMGASPWMEYMDDNEFWQPRGFQPGFVEPVLPDESGCVTCPDAPGLGIEWDVDWLEGLGLAVPRG